MRTQGKWYTVCSDEAWYIYAKDGATDTAIAKLRTKDNAAYIVKACNNFEPMLEALKAAQHWIFAPDERRQDSGAVRRLLNQMNEAIRLAEEGNK